MSSQGNLETNHTFVGGQISQRLKEWEKITSDPWILGTVKGVQIPFEEVPIQQREPTPY